MLRLLLIASFALAAAAARAEAPKVVVTIQPVHALVTGVMQGVGEAKLLVPAAASEHTFSLKPSDAKALQEADLVFWVGEGLESFMAKPLQSLPRKARLVELAATPGMTLLENREGGAWEAHEDEHEHGHGHAREREEAHDDDETDMHIWLDPANAVRIAEVAAEHLAAVDPANAARYAENARAVAAEIQALDAELVSLFAPVRQRPFIVFHDAYQYLERRYGLNAVGSVTVPERKPSAKRLREIRRKIADLKAACVFSEPQFDAALVRTVLEGTPARTAALDHLGVDAAPGVAGYVEMMRGLGRTLAGCLAETS